MGGDKVRKSVVYDIMMYKNRQMYYRIHNVPTTYLRKVIQIKN